MLDFSMSHGFSRPKLTIPSTIKPRRIICLTIKNLRNFIEQFSNSALKLFFVFVALGTAVLTYDLVFFNNLDYLPALHQGLFMAVSAITTTGFSIVNIHTWASVTILFLAMLVFIGGASGSTAGGIKLHRVILAIPDDWCAIGARIELAVPGRTNVQFVHVLDRTRVVARIWERGAGRTLASGSSASAIARVVTALGLCDSPIEVGMEGGTLTVEVDASGRCTIDGPIVAIARVELDRGW